MIFNSSSASLVLQLIHAPLDLSRTVRVPRKTIAFSMHPFSFTMHPGVIRFRGRGWIDFYSFLTYVGTNNLTFVPI